MRAASYLLIKADDSKSKVVPKAVAPLHGRISFFFAAPALKQTTLCLSPPAFRSVIRNKEESEQGEIEDYYWTGSVWHGGEAGITRKSDKNREAHSFSEEDESDHLGSILPFSVSSPPGE